MRIYNKEQVRLWDAFTITQEPIKSIDLMERASKAFCKWIETIYFDTQRPIVIFAGFGNNGGDALAIARILHEKKYKVKVFLVHFDKKMSDDCFENLSRLQKLNVEIQNISETTLDLDFDPHSLLIDGIFGSGLSRSLDGVFANIIHSINKLHHEVVAIDIPSGLDADLGNIGPVIRATRTFSFQTPKQAFFLRDSMPYVGSWDYGSIGLHPDFHQNEKTNVFSITRNRVRTFLKKRNPTADKSEFGFGQLCGGSQGMLGAILLASKAAYRIGLGRLIISTLSIHNQSIFSYVPEAMIQNLKDRNINDLTHFEIANTQINAIACGPGLSTRDSAVQFLDQLLNANSPNLVLDADALNIIARKKWLKRIPKETILTPHYREFQRLFGQVYSHSHAIEVQKKMSQELGIIIVLKGPNSSISGASGSIFFNTTGNVGMATAGSGDVLTGILLGLNAQGYEPEISAQLGTFIHGMAADLAVEKYGIVSLIASDIIEFIPQVVKNLYEI